MTQDASIEDDEPDIVGPIVIGTTVVVGGAVLGYQPILWALNLQAS